MATQRYTQPRLLRQMGAKCRLKVLQNAIISLEKQTIFCLRQVLLYTLKLNRYPIRENNKEKIPLTRPIPVKQGRVGGNKNIFKVGLSNLPENISMIPVSSENPHQILLSDHHIWNFAEKEDKVKL